MAGSWARSIGRRPTRRSIASSSTPTANVKNGDWGTMPTRQKAYAADIIAAARREGTPSPDSTVRDLCFQFLDQSKANNSHKTYLGYCTYLKSFCESLPPSLRVREMLKAHLENWLTKTYPAKGNPNTRRAAVVAVKRVFNWSVKQMGWFDRSPLDGYPTPAGVPRETLLAPEQWATVLGRAMPDDPFHDFLRVMICTGCRPQEVRIMAARHINWKRQTAFFERGEVPGKKSRARTVRLPSDVVAILRKWASKNPQGPVLRNEDGNPWSSTAVVSRFRRLQKKVPDFRPIAYLSRHSFTTLLCEAGDADVAK